MKTRRERLPVIIELLNHQAITSQQELAQMLNDRGFRITQATLSRDLKLLKARKSVDDQGLPRYCLADPHQGLRCRPRRPTMAMNHATTLSMVRTGNLVVIKTRNGYASGLAYDIDSLDSPIILGSIPGADTVFVALREGTPRSEAFELFATLLPENVIAQARPYFLDDESE